METQIDLAAAARSKNTRFTASAIYFFFYAAVASVVPFFVLYLQSLGFTGAQIGAITSMGPLLGLIGTPLWTGVADVRNRHKVVLLGGMSVAILINLALPFLRTYALIFAAQVLMALLTPHMLAMQDSATIHSLGAQRDRYGQIRIWGTVGWGVSAPLVGALLGVTGLIWMFWIYALFMTVTLILARQTQFESSGEQVAYFKSVGRLLKDWQWLLFLAIAFVGGFGMAPHGNYLPLLVQKVAGNVSLLVFVGSVSAMVGLALTVSTVFEAPIMLASHRFLGWLGSRGTIFLAMLMVGLRNLLYGYVSTPEAVVGVQILHGLTYPLLWIAGVSFVAEKAPKGLGATAQGVFSAAIMGIGTSSGNYICGLLIDRLGVSGMFTWVGIFGLASTAAFFIISRRIK